MTRHDVIARTIDVVGFLSRERVFNYVQYHANTQQFTNEPYVYETFAIHTRAVDPSTHGTKNYTSDDLKEEPHDALFTHTLSATHAETGDLHEFRMCMDGVLRRYHAQCPEKWVPCMLKHGVQHTCTVDCHTLNESTDEKQACLYYNLYLEQHSFVELPPHIRVTERTKQNTE